ncbi:MAG: holo-ACP synthase [Fimbriimonadales bacterium]|nr:holo-ACP synthase [Fimbriimonadales bacterium]
MIEAIGVDMVSVPRIERAMRNPRFVPRVLSPVETEGRMVTPAFVAGRWAAKEAVAKCLGAPIPWHDVEIVSNAGEAPRVRVNPVRLPPGRTVLLSISHEREAAIAVAILVSATP